jgi:hypothetical protein
LINQPVFSIEIVFVLDQFVAQKGGWKLPVRAIFSSVGPLARMAGFNKDTEAIMKSTAWPLIVGAIMVTGCSDRAASESQLQDALARNKVLTSQVEQLQDALARNKNLSAQITQFQDVLARNKDISGQIEHLQATVNQLQQTASDQQGTRVERDKWTEEQAKHSATVASLQTAIQQKDNAVETMRVSMDAMQKQIADKDLLIATLQQQLSIASAQSQKDEVEPPSRRLTGEGLQGPKPKGSVKPYWRSY